jgi:hypothetical protein
MIKLTQWLAIIFFIFFLTSNNYANAYINIEKNKELLSSIPEANIYLYANENKERNSYQDFLLVSGKIKRSFAWTNVLGKPSYSLPQLMLSDINKDGKKELVIILTHATGTHLYINEAHIFNPESLDEYRIVDPITAILLNVKDHITPEGIEITINNKKTIIKDEDIKTPKKERNIHLDYGDRIEFRVENDELVAYVAAAIGSYEWVANFKITYVYKNRIFQSKLIEIRKIGE